MKWNKKDIQNKKKIWLLFYFYSHFIDQMLFHKGVWDIIDPVGNDHHQFQWQALKRFEESGHLRKSSV